MKKLLFALILLIAGITHAQNLDQEEVITHRLACSPDHATGQFFLRAVD